MGWLILFFFFFFSSRRRHTRCGRDWSSDVCSSDLTTRTFAYTNHTVMPEALERWPVSQLGNMLPRHLEIIYEINERFLGLARTRLGADDELARRLSLIDEDSERRVRMAHLAIV